MIPDVEFAQFARVRRPSQRHDQSIRSVSKRNRRAIPRHFGHRHASSQIECNLRYAVLQESKLHSSLAGNLVGIVAKGQSKNIVLRVDSILPGISISRKQCIAEESRKEEASHRDEVYHQ